MGQDLFSQPSFGSFDLASHVCISGVEDVESVPIIFSWNTCMHVNISQLFLRIGSKKTRRSCTYWMIHGILISNGCRASSQKVTWIRCIGWFVIQPRIGNTTSECSAARDRPYKSDSMMCDKCDHVSWLLLCMPRLNHSAIPHHQCPIDWNRFKLANGRPTVQYNLIEPLVSYIYIIDIFLLQPQHTLNQNKKFRFLRIESIIQVATIMW